MRVGIITVHSVPNYGAVLQAYALASYLRSEKYDVRTVDYRQPQLEELYRMRWRFPPPLNHWLRLRRNERFVETMLPLSAGRYHSRAEFERDIGQYDAFITGSDQVWFTGPVQGYDPLYFLDFAAPGKRKISYAASAGGTVQFGEAEDRVRHALADFDHVAVRDSHTSSLVAPLLGREPVQVVDPVFLSDFAELPADSAPSREPYLLVFGDFSGELTPVLRGIVEATGLTNVVSLQYPCAVATRRIAAPSPATWLSYFRNAAFVVTSYFHGTAIATKFERPFITIPTPGRRLKVATLLQPLGLSSRCFLEKPSTAQAAEVVRAGIDWQFTRQKLAEQIANSRKFLKSALQ